MRLRDGVRSDEVLVRPRQPRNDGYTCTFWRQAKGGIAYVRAVIPARHLGGQVLTVRLDDLAEDKDGDAFLWRNEGPAVWLHAGTLARALLIANEHDRGVRQLLDVDDNYLLRPPLAGRIESEWVHHAPRNGDDAPSVEMHRKVAAFVDGITCSTEALCEAYARHNRNVYHCPNAVDPADWPEPAKPDDGVLRIGWAASTSHLLDERLIRKACEWAAKQKNVEVVLIGLDPHWPFPYRHIPWSDSLSRYRQTLAQLDVMLCPLRPGAWADGRSDLKALEAAMALAYPVCSDVRSYAPWQGRCHLADDAKGFLAAVRELHSLGKDEVRRLAREACSYVLRERTIEAVLFTWKEALAL